MHSLYFEKLKDQGRYVDDGIEKLTNMWKLPSVFIGHFGDLTEETKLHIETLWNVTKSTQNRIEETLEQLKDGETENPESLKQLLEETEKEYESIKKYCDHMESVAAVYGYHYDKVDTSDPINTSDKESVQNMTMRTDSFKGEFTPNLKWKCKTKQNEPLTPLFNGSCMENSTMSVTNNTLSILKDTNSTYGNSPSISVRKHLEEPTYSEHFYKLKERINQAQSDVL